MKPVYVTVVHGPYVSQGPVMHDLVAEAFVRGNSKLRCNHRERLSRFQGYSFAMGWLWNGGNTFSGAAVFEELEPA